MSAPRRRLVRPATAPPDPQRQRRLRKLREGLERERAALARWMARLKRAFHRVEQLQRTVARLDRRINHQEDT